MVTPGGIVEYPTNLARDRINPERMIPETLTITAGISREFDTALSKVSEYLDWHDKEKALKCLGEGWIGEEAVAVALYCFLKHPIDYKTAVLIGGNTNRGSDSVAFIAGCISRAYPGVATFSGQGSDVLKKTYFSKS